MKTILYQPLFINPQAYFVFPQLYHIEKGDSYIEHLLNIINEKANKKDVYTIAQTNNAINRSKTVVENVLTSTSTTTALSSAQGKILNDLITSLTARVQALETPKP